MIINILKNGKTFENSGHEVKKEDGILIQKLISQMNQKEEVKKEEKENGIF